MPPPGDIDTGRELGKITAKLDQIITSMVNSEVLSTKIDHLEKTSFRLMLAMLGIIAATLGTRLINTPSHLIIATYTAAFAAVFLIGFGIKGIYRVHWSKTLMRFLFAGLVLFSTGIRLFIYEAGLQVAPIWYSPVIDVCYILVSMVMVVSTWKDNQL